MIATWRFEGHSQEALISYMKRAQEILIHRTDKSEKLFTINMRESFINVDAMHTAAKFRVLFRGKHHSICFADAASADRFLLDYQAAFQQDKYEKQLQDSQEFEFPQSDDDTEVSSHERTGSIVHEPTVISEVEEGATLKNQVEPCTESTVSEEHFVSETTHSCVNAARVFNEQVFYRAPWILSSFDGYENAFIYECYEGDNGVIPILIPRAPQQAPLTLNSAFVYIIAEVFTDMQSNTKEFTHYVLSAQDSKLFREAIFVCSQLESSNVQHMDVFPSTATVFSKFKLIAVSDAEQNKQLESRYGRIQFTTEVAAFVSSSEADEKSMWTHFCTEYERSLQAGVCDAEADFSQLWGSLPARSRTSERTRSECYINTGKRAILLLNGENLLAGAPYKVEGQCIFVANGHILVLEFAMGEFPELSVKQKAMQLELVSRLRSQYPQYEISYIHSQREFQTLQAAYSNCDSHAGMVEIMDLAVIKIQNKAPLAIQDSGAFKLAQMSLQSCYFVIAKDAGQALCIIGPEASEDDKFFAKDYARANKFTVLTPQQLRCAELAWFADGFTFAEGRSPPLKEPKLKPRIEKYGIQSQEGAVPSRKNFKLKFSIATDYENASHNAKALEFSEKHFVITHLTSGTAHLFNYKIKDLQSAKSGSLRQFGQHEYEVFTWSGAHSLARQSMREIAPLHFSDLDCGMRTETEFDESAEFLALRDFIVYSVGSYWTNLRGSWKVIQELPHQDRSELRLFKAYLHENKIDVIALQEMFVFDKTVYYTSDTAIMVLDYVGQRIVVHYGSHCCSFLENRLSRVAKYIFGRETEGFKVKQYDSCKKKYKDIFKLKELSTAGEPESVAPDEGDVDAQVSDHQDVDESADDLEAAPVPPQTRIYRVIQRQTLYELFEVSELIQTDSFDYYIENGALKYLVIKDANKDKRLIKLLDGATELIQLGKPDKRAENYTKLQALVPGCFGIKLTFIDQLTYLPRVSYLAACAVHKIDHEMRNIQRQRYDEYEENGFARYYALQQQFRRDYAGQATYADSSADSFIDTYVAEYGGIQPVPPVQFADMIIPVAGMVDESDAE